MTMPSKKPVVVVVGQIPPPVGGQNIMIERVLRQLSTEEEWEVLHLPMNFIVSFTQIRKFSAGKVIELFRVVWRLLRIRMMDTPDVVIYPFGGKHMAPILRDIFLIPLFRLCSRKFVIWFHTGGIAEKLPKMAAHFRGIYRGIFQKVDAGIVMTDFNRCDPEALGIERVYVVPHTIEDRFGEEEQLQMPKGHRILYLGNIYPDKGVPQLLEAFSILAKEDALVTLDLVGEPANPWNEEIVNEKIAELPHGDRVRRHGMALGKIKDEFFQNADIFIFPSVAPGESFGLVLAEALMWGKAVVATDWRGNSDVLTKRFFGELVPANPLKAEELAAAIGRVLSAEETRAEIFQKNRQIYLDRYCFETNPSRISNCIREVLESRKPQLGQ